MMVMQLCGSKLVNSYTVYVMLNFDNNNINIVLSAFKLLIRIVLPNKHAIYS